MSRLSVLLIDNFDSFSFNLAYEFLSLGCDVSVWRNDISAEQAFEIYAGLEGPKLIALSPGPGAPSEAGCLIDLIQKADATVPIFGVCLGHQAIVEAFGGKVQKAERVLHGKSSRLTHTGDGLFLGLPDQLHVARYHSLCAAQLPDCLIQTASASGVCMAVQHRDRPILGIQFHPESILTPTGSVMIKNLLSLVGKETL